ncbi:hypothetical protein Peur_011981 [Populus x canadensis]
MTFDLGLQVQFIVSMFATLFCSFPMIMNKVFQNNSNEVAFCSGYIQRGRRIWSWGNKVLCYTINISNSIADLQLLVIGIPGVIYSSTSPLDQGLYSSLLVPVQQAFAMIFLQEVFHAGKGMALAMCLWGFASYLYGEYLQINQKPTKKNQTTS